jgi:carboxymethylenebutenolidase
MGRTIELTTADSAVISAYRADPAGAPKGGIVVLQEIFGVNRHIRSVADGFAAAGYLAVAPALFDRAEPGIELGYDASSFPKGMGLRQAASIPESLADIAAAVRIAAEGGKVGVVGYCWGGLLAFLAAAHVPGIAAAVGYYGGTIAKHLADGPQAPTILHFGEFDTHIPVTEIDAIRAAFPEMPVYTYPADHGFNCDERASYDKSSADLALERTLSFFETHLR